MANRNFLGEFEQVVLLAVMRLGADAYGVTIRREIETCTGRSVSLGAIYPTLHRLEAKKLVTSRTGGPTATRGGRAKRFFVIEEAGLSALRQSRAMMLSLWQGHERDLESRG